MLDTSNQTATDPNIGTSRPRGEEKKSDLDLNDDKKKNLVKWVFSYVISAVIIAVGILVIKELFCNDSFKSGVLLQIVNNIGVLIVTSLSLIGFTQISKS